MDTQYSILFFFVFFSPTLFREAGKLDSNSIKALKELLATPDEKMGILSYMKQTGASSGVGKSKSNKANLPSEEDIQKEQEALYNDLSETEKYMYTMFTTVLDADRKLDCMLFRSQFYSRYKEIIDSIQIVEMACDEIRHSDKLRNILAMILTVVNQINTGGEEENEQLMASGFALDALLKLNEVW